MAQADQAAEATVAETQQVHQPLELLTQAEVVVAAVLMQYQPQTAQLVVQEL
jgi:hypothetical protein